MANDINEGKLTQVKGKAKEQSGKATGNTSKELEGMMEQAGGKIQEEFGKSNRSVKKAIKD